ncbi:hypothetical protein QOT17_014724 [Balamuthia mandrillaris]
MTMKTALVVGLVLLAVTCSFSRGDDDVSCVGAKDSFAPVKNEHMETCCWFSGYTCCDKTTWDSIGPETVSALKTLSSQVTGDCYYVFADLLCSRCAPDNDHFAKGSYFRICSTFCESLFHACEGQLDKVPQFSGAKDPGELCQLLSKNISWVIPETAGDTSSCYHEIARESIKKSECLPSQENDDRFDVFSRSVASFSSSFSLSFLFFLLFSFLGGHLFQTK